MKQCILRNTLWIRDRKTEEFEKYTDELQLEGEGLCDDSIQEIMMMHCKSFLDFLGSTGRLI